MQISNDNMIQNRREAMRLEKRYKGRKRSGSRRVEWSILSFKPEGRERDSAGWQQRRTLFSEREKRKSRREEGEGECRGVLT